MAMAIQSAPAEVKTHVGMIKRLASAGNSSIFAPSNRLCQAGAFWTGRSAFGTRWE